MSDFYFDASILGPGKAFALLRNDIIYPGHDRCPPDIQSSTKDDIWLPRAGREGWQVVMRDKKIRSRPGERAALKDHGVGAFCLTGSGNQLNWDMASLLMKWWPRIEEMADTSRPYLYSVTRQGVQPLML